MLIVVMMMMMVLKTPLLSTCNSHFLYPSPLPQSCHDEEDEDGEEVKSFEVGDQSVLWWSLAVNWFAATCQTCVLFHRTRRRRWRSRSCCISRLGCMTVEQLRWCFRPSVPAKVGFLPPTVTLLSTTTTSL